MATVRRPDGTRPRRRSGWLVRPARVEGPGTRVQFWVRGTPGERTSGVRYREGSRATRGVARPNWPAERHTSQPGCDLLRRGPRRNGRSDQDSGGALQVTPHRYPGRPTGEGPGVSRTTPLGRGAPDPPEAGDDVERRRIPRRACISPTLMSHSGVPVPGHRDPPNGRGIDTGARSEVRRRARSLASPDPWPRRAAGIRNRRRAVGHRDVTPGSGPADARAKSTGLSAPALVHHRQLGKLCPALSLMILCVSVPPLRWSNRSAGAAAGRVCQWG